MCMAHPLSLPYLSVKFNKVCLSKLSQRFNVTSGLHHEFGKNNVGNRLSNYGLPLWELC